MSFGYLLASLPMLFPDRAPSVTIENFVSTCEAVLSKKDAEAARILVTASDEESSHAYVKHWRGLEAAIEGAIGAKRLAKRGLSRAETAPPMTSLAPVWLTRMIENAFDTAPDPLAREEALLRVRWAAAEDMGGVDPLAKAQLFAYAVKLRLAVRHAALNIETGRERLETALPKQTL